MPRIRQSEVDTSVTAPSWSSATAMIEPSAFTASAPAPASIRVGPPMRSARSRSNTTRADCVDVPCRGYADWLRVSRPQHGTDPAVTAHLDERTRGVRLGIEPEVQVPEHVSGSGIADAGLAGGT